MIINDKRVMYGLQSRMRLGNSLTIWYTITELRRDSYDGPVAIRCLVPGTGIVTHIAQNDLEKATDQYLMRKGCKREDIVYSEMAAPSMGIRRLMNGQLTRTEEGFYLEFGTSNIHLNEAMMSPHRAKLLKAKLLLEHMADPPDFDDLNLLLEEYEDPVVEFSILDKSVGWANRRMVVWEVRHY